MVDIYLWLFIAICIGLLGWGLARPERVYQYPFFMGGIFVSFILPQAIALINNPGPVTQEALERVLLMACLCAAMCWIGYQLPTRSSLLKKFDISVDRKKLFYGGIVFVLIGYACTFLIFQLPEAVRDNSQWTGIITIYTFFSSLVYPGFTIILLSTLQRPTLTKILLTAISAGLPIQAIVFFGRRESAAIFILAIGLCLYFFRRYVPPRWLAIAMIIVALLVIPLTGNYRSIAKTNNWEQVLELQPIENLHNFVEKGQSLEFRNAALLVDAASITGRYGYGTDYWNNFIFRFIPAQIVGKNLKDALQIKISISNYNFQKLYNYKIPAGSTFTGIADAFVQFNYFGSLFFLFSGYLFKHLWISAICRYSIVSQIFYVGLVTPAMISVTHATVRFPSDLLFYCIFLGTLIICSRQKSISAIKWDSQYYDNM